MKGVRRASVHPGVDHASFAVSDTYGSISFLEDLLEGGRRFPAGNIAKLISGISGGTGKCI